MHKRILLAYDGSEAGQKALLECGEIARWSHAELYLVAVMPALAARPAVDEGTLHRASSSKFAARTTRTGCDTPGPIEVPRAAPIPTTTSISGRRRTTCARSRCMSLPPAASFTGCRRR